MKWGAFEIELISDGTFRLDGGAMFGVVPRVLWNRVIDSDERNRIQLGLNCLLIRTDRDTILIDTGCGFKYTRKLIDIYGIDHETSVIDELKRVNVDVAAIDCVINTHLHFDHCGGNTRVQGDEFVPTFPNARYFVQKREYLDASSPNERTRATYLAENWKPVEDRGQLELLEGTAEIVPGITCVPTPGHTAGHQSVKIESEGKILFFIADLCPTQKHVPLPWIMGYDLFPLTTLETRKRIYAEALQEEWLLLFEHDNQDPLGRLKQGDKDYQAEAVEWPKG